MSDTGNDHGEHVARRLADGWYAVETCEECKREFNSPAPDDIQEAPSRPIDFDRALSLLQTANEHLRKNIGKPCSCQHCYVCALQYLAYELPKQARAEVLAACIHEIRFGRTINNFAHLPQVVRALEWVVQDLRALQPAASALEELLEEARKQTRDENPNRYLARCSDCGANL